MSSTHPKLDAMLDTLDGIAHELNAETDRLHGALDSIERRLGGVGVEAWTDDPVDGWCFGYARLGQHGWRLVVRRPGGSPIALRDAQRPVRIAAAACVGDLIQKIAGKAAAYVTATRAANDLVRR